MATAQADFGEERAGEVVPLVLLRSVVRLLGLGWHALIRQPEVVLLQSK